MGIREKANQNPLVVVITMIAVLAVSIGLLVYRMRVGTKTGIEKLAFYTIDDGKTWFPDDSNKLAPFTKDGKTAYRVFVWTCDGGKTKFVSHLERYTPEAKSGIEQSRNQRQADPGLLHSIMTTGVEVKKPNDSAWVKRGAPEGIRIATPRCPDGTSDNLEPVSPE